MFETLLAPLFHRDAEHPHKHIGRLVQHVTHGVEWVRGTHLPAHLSPSIGMASLRLLSGSAEGLHRILWGQGEVFDWFSRLKEKERTDIAKIRWMREKGFFSHEYIFVQLRTGTIMRFERSPDPKASPTQTFQPGGCEAWDTLDRDLKGDLCKIEEHTCLAEMVFGRDVHLDLQFILDVCLAINRDEIASKYTLQEYNCYFFARTIFTLVVRQAILNIARSPSHLDAIRWDTVDDALPTAIDQAANGIITHAKLELFGLSAPVDIVGQMLENWRPGIVETNTPWRGESISGVVRGRVQKMLIGTLQQTLWRDELVEICKEHHMVDETPMKDISMTSPVQKTVRDHITKLFSRIMADILHGHEKGDVLPSVIELHVLPIDVSSSPSVVTKTDKIDLEPPGYLGAELGRLSPRHPSYVSD
ncbi:hypothetical protein JAAARDRAFT_61969 [Jaapia argillacea MUCL 33604]|uniref:Uncharacterized protein n=1 Tax=Jaapia argillacea MUCL 33604 TaxID=933084 RepID=A0A067PF39_9AGAM|nr:hypothetical protein JAAARDRAFT_61969 [Jaapia argillacea MUCL 33604]